MQERKYLTALFQKYQEGLVNEEEKQIIAHWLVYLDVHEKELTADELQIKRQLSQNALKEHLFPGVHSSPKIIRFPLWIRSVAATLLIMLTAGGVFYLINKNHHSQISQVAFEEQVTHTGEMKILILTDGTKITLNNESKIKFPVAFDDKAREVFLTGEAFFEVVHNSAKPFKVHTDKLDVQVLGTSFNIKAYPDDKRSSVSVRSGKVGVLPTSAKAAKPYFLLPGDQLAYNRITGKFSRLKVDPSIITDWQKGVLTFNNESLVNITRQLARFYKVTFQFENKELPTKELSLKLKNQSLPIVMKALSISGDFHYKINGNKVTIW